MKSAITLDNRGADLDKGDAQDGSSSMVDIGMRMRMTLQRLISTCSENRDRVVQQAHPWRQRLTPNLRGHPTFHRHDGFQAVAPDIRWSTPMPITGHGSPIPSVWRRGQRRMIP